MKHRRTLATLLAAASLILASCADDPDSSGAETFNEADVAFAQGMIPHHQQAIEMAALAPERAASAEVRDLAADIEAAQGPEIETMTGWLEAWGEDVPDGGMDGMDGMDHGDMSGDAMPGMMSRDEMDGLTAATGAEFDQMFLTMMIEHHEGAIEMAATERADGENPEAVTLAKQIANDQLAEIQVMQGLLAS